MTTAGEPLTVLLVSGSTRPGSTNTAALRTAAGLPVAGVAAVLWERLRDIPAFVPEDPAEPPAAVSELQRLLTEADAVLFCTPEYAGTLPGSLKNAIDWLVGSGELYRKPVAWTNVAAPGRGTGAEATLSSVLGYVDAAVIERACLRIPVARSMITADGTVADPDVRSRLAAQLGSVVEHLRPTAPPEPVAGPDRTGEPAADDVRVEAYAGPREDLRSLFELAEDSAAELDSYLHDGQVLVAVSGSEVIGHLQLVETDHPGRVELKNMAVREARQGHGVGRRLVRAAVELAATGPATHMVVATAAADLGNLRFYQRQGFRMLAVERDAFTEATGYPPGITVEGIPLRDRVWLDMELQR